jgi:hypothetical protein
MNDTLKAEAASKLQGYLASGIAGLFRQAWDRLNACGFDVDLRREATKTNAKALLWIAENR